MSVYTVEEAIDKLAALGSAQQIADYLAAEGFRGQPQTSNYCPVANYLRKTAGTTAVSVDGVRAVIPTCSFEADRPYYTVDRYPLPEEIRSFIVGFDRLRYPQLLPGQSDER